LTIYLDHAATTPLAPEVFATMQPWLTEKFGNASSIHRYGQCAKNALEFARAKIAKILCCESSEIIFTSGGTESDNLALSGILLAHNLDSKLNSHAIISTIEHPAILNTATALENFGVKFSRIAPNNLGEISSVKILAAIRKNTKLISIQLANNEIGVIQPVREIGKVLRKKQKNGETTPLLHSDAVQAAGSLSLNVQHLKVDLLSLSAHKFYGPCGIGILFVRNGIKIASQNRGGEQEWGKRAGTENIAGIVGAAVALELAEKKREREVARLSKLRDFFEAEILREIPKSRINGATKNRLPSHTNFSFQGIEGESLLLRLDFEGIAAATGSACSSRSITPSHVLQALKLPATWMHGSIRFSLGRKTRKSDLIFVIKKLKKIVADLREISAL
jgi:cysteine desulfurase